MSISIRTRSVSEWMFLNLGSSVIITLLCALAPNSSAQSLMIVSPVANTVVSPGQNVSISVTRTGASIAQVAVYAAGWTASLSGTDPLIFNITIPPDALPGLLSVIAVDTTIHPHHGLGVVSPLLALQVESQTVFTSLVPTSPVLQFASIGDHTLLGIMGAFNLNVPVSLNGSSKLSYVSQNPAVISVDPTGLVSATGPGNSVITVQYTNPDSSVLALAVPVSVPAVAQVAVPNVAGLMQAVATTAITGAGLVLGTVTTAASSTVPAGNVISESPTAGTLVSSGSAVNLVISTGVAQVAVPNVVGLTQAAATTAITGAGLVLGTVTNAASSTVPAGNVISESPAAGTLVSSGSAVNLVISTGVAQVAVPNVVGLTQAAATTSITGAGLVLGKVTNAASSTVPAGNVISESPAAGTLVSSGSAVNLVISTGVAVPVITWANPADILYGSALGPTQLSATANTAGTFVYTPSLGTVLSIGDGQTLQVNFIPTDAVHFVGASKTVVINVKPLASSGPANLVVTAQLSRDSVTNEVIVNLTVANSGGTTAAAVQLTGVSIGATSSTTLLPISLGNIVVIGQARATIRLPGVVGAAGTHVVLSVAGSSTGSSFGGNIRVTLP